MAKNTELSLFQMTQPELLAGLQQNVRNDAAGNPIAITMTIMKRKEVAKANGLEVKGAATTAKLLELSDAMKVAAAGEFAKLAASADFTGAGMTVRKLKDGRMKVSASLVSVQRETKSITPEQLAKALAAMTEDEQIAIMDEAEKIAKAAHVVELAPAGETAKADTQAAETIKA